MNLYLEAAVNNFPNCLILRGAKNSGTCLNHVLITFVKDPPTLRLERFHKKKQELTTDVRFEKVVTHDLVLLHAHACVRFDFSFILCWYGTERAVKLYDIDIQIILSK